MTKKKTDTPHTTCRPKEHFRPNEFAEVEGFNPNTLVRWLRDRDTNGLLAAAATYKIGNRIYINRTNFFKWFNSHLEKPALVDEEISY